VGVAGGFNWVDLTTTDYDGSKAFYTGLFGWEAQDQRAGEAGVYTMFRSGGVPVAGSGAYRSGQRAMGLPAVWTSYVTVESADAAVARSVRLGGRILLPAMDAMAAGRMAMIAGPTGEVFGVWQDGKHAGAGKFNEPVSLTWNELATPNPEIAAAFYTGLFGWITRISESGPAPYTIFENGGRPNGGMYDMVGVVPEGLPAQWLPYFAVADADDIVNRCGALGGTVVNGPTNVPDAGRMAILTDPQGGRFSILEGAAPPAP
jgi:predicted enzyme related to lactoylglutathione lyase